MGTGQLLMVSDLGLISYDIETDEVSITKADNNGVGNKLNDNYLQSIFIDNEGALWIGTYFGGVNYVSPYQRLFSHYYKGNTNLGAKVISVFAKAADNNLWLGSDDAGVFLWDRHDNSFTSICHHPCSRAQLIGIYMQSYRMATACLSGCIWEVLT